VQSNSVVISCIKLAQADDAIILRLLEQHGKPSHCAVKLNLPGNWKIISAYTADAIERRRDVLAVSVDNIIKVNLRPYEIVTIGFVPKLFGSQ